MTEAKPTLKPLALGAPETQSADVVAENLGRLRALFPEAFVEGKIDFDVLRQLLGGAVDEHEEKYGLNWHGKRAARQLALTPSTGTLRPCPEESVDWDTTQNLMIEGDNLEVLKLLQKSYAGKVKLIYIDPPYNTGTDRVYKDDFGDNVRNFLELTGQLDSVGRRLTENTLASGRFHTDWLSMMLPRLRVAAPSCVLMVLCSFRSTSENTRISRASVRRCSAKKICWARSSGRTRRTTTRRESPLNTSTSSSSPETSTALLLPGSRKSRTSRIFSSGSGAS